jgi:uncharacterized membrane protein (UPF0127 family)
MRFGSSHANVGPVHASGTDVRTVSLPRVPWYWLDMAAARPSGSIHTWFVRFAIDAVFLDRDFRVVHTATGIRPWRVARARRARAGLEFADGEAARRGIAVGDRLVLG